MRLIDVDRLLKEFPIRINHYDKENGNFRYVLGIEAVMDYVKEMPTVEAIPIEWLKEKCNEADNMGMGIDDWSVKDCYELVLGDWGKENEDNR